MKLSSVGALVLDRLVDLILETNFESQRFYIENIIYNMMPGHCVWLVPSDETLRVFADPRYEASNDREHMRVWALVLELNFVIGEANRRVDSILAWE